MALLTFPVSPINGEIYPNPLFAPIGTHIYQWSALEQTWVLLGRASGVTPGTYGNAYTVPQFTVDAVGRITFAQDLPIPLATTSQVGLVQIVDNTVTNDPAKALTAAQGFYLQNQIGTLSLLSPPAPNLVSALNGISARTAADWPVVPAINGSSNIQSALENALYSVTSPASTIVVTEAPTGNLTLEVIQASEVQLGGAEIATQAEVDAGTDDNRIVTPLKLSTVFNNGSINSSTIKLSTPINGNTTVQGALVDAIYNVASANSSVTITETATGQVDLAVTQATETQIGGAEVATQAETDAGTSDTLMVTPLKLATYISSGQINATEVPLSPAINGNTTVQAALNDAIYSVASTTLTVTEAAVGNLTVQMPNTGVVAGTYAPATITVDAQGRITSAASSGVQFYHYTQIDDISGGFDGTATSFNLAVGGVAYVPNPVGNLMVFLGGVAQIPGAANAYTVGGSIITFTSPPPAGTTFYATTVTNT